MKCKQITPALFSLSANGTGKKESYFFLHNEKTNIVRKYKFNIPVLFNHL